MLVYKHLIELYIHVALIYNYINHSQSEYNNPQSYPIDSKHSAMPIIIVQP